jgi:hypothetical protein
MSEDDGSGNVAGSGMAALRYFNVVDATESDSDLGADEKTINVSIDQQDSIRLNTSELEGNDKSVSISTPPRDELRLETSSIPTLAAPEATRQFPYLFNDPPDRSQQFHLFNKPVDLPGDESIASNLKRLDSHSNYISAFVDAWQLMRNSGEWNYKRTYGRDWKDAGDFNFGVMARALGVPLDSALRFAGWYATNHGTHVQEWGHWTDRSGNYGHDPHAQEKIKQGYEYYNHRDLIDILYNNPGTRLPEAPMPEVNQPIQGLTLP